MSKAPSYQARIKNTLLLTPDLRAITLEPLGSQSFPAASPGAHIILELRDGQHIWRNPYSIISPPGTKDRYDIIVRRTSNSRGGSAYIHSSLQIGDRIALSGPQNFFWPTATAQKHLLIAGGIGVTPFISFLPYLVQDAMAYELHLACRADDAEAFRHILKGWNNIHIHPDGQNPRWDSAELLAQQPLGTHLYLCGPEAFMAKIKAESSALGWPNTRLHQEFFGSAAPGNPFSVMLARSAITLKVDAHQTLLEALELAGIDAPCLCRGGACGQCKLRVLQGEPEHHDHFLTDAERAGNDSIMTCVSRAKSPLLVLDI